MFGNPMEIAILVGAAVLLFGADRVPKLARGIGQAKKEFMVGQAEADVAAERTRAEARALAEANVARTAAADMQSQTVNGVVVGAPMTPTEPAAPPN
jgi:sec-independent protein translocase protein TatA